MKVDGLAFVYCARSGVAQVSSRNYLVTTYYGLYLQSVQLADISDCTFQYSYGSALGVVDSHVVLTGNNSFLNNCRLCSRGRCYYYSVAHCFGGGVFAIRSNVSFNGSYFRDENTTFVGNLGGGIHADNNSNVDIRGNSVFLGNIADSGGGIRAETNSNVNVSGKTIFIGNSGGGVCAHFDSNINISGNTTFIGNSARNGGGIYACFESNISISGNTNFINNSVIGKYSDGKGGGIHASHYSNIIISGNTAFINNTAKKNGGGIYLECASNINISGNTTFISNSASGGVYIIGQNGLADLLGPRGHTMISGRGGGIYTCGRCESGEHSHIKISTGLYFVIDHMLRKKKSSNNIEISGNTTFICNSASSGGGIYILYNNNMDIHGNTMFIGNSGRRGGGVYAGTETNVNISGTTTFVNNSAESDGGGAYASTYSNVNVKESTNFTGNSATDGGGLYVASGSNVKIMGNTMFTSNSAVHGGGIFLDNSLSLDGNCSFINCSAYDGGAIYAEGVQMNFNATNVFRANTAQHFGGGLYAYKAFFNFSGDSTFTANMAGSSGGGIYTQETKISFSGTSMFSSNVAQLDGGGIYADDSNLNFRGSVTIRGNTAQLGGGVYSDNNTFSIDGHNIIERNIATQYGGGIYAQRSPLNLPGKNTFIANSAGEGGGMYATANSTLNLNGVNSFVGNRAHVSGGGIWLDHSNLALDGFNHFVECAASYEGGAIFTYAATTSLPGNNTFESNSATTGGGIHARWSKVSVTNICSFKQNIAVFGGGIYTDNSTFELTDISAFRGNQANHTGGSVYAARSTLNFFGVSFMAENRAARDGGGIYTRDECVVNLLGISNYHNNSAGDSGGGISAFRSILNLAGRNAFNRNHAVEGGGFYAFKTTVSIPGVISFITNSASNHGGGFTVMHSAVHLNGSTTFKNNSAASGGAIYFGDSTVNTDGSNCFMNNNANFEGGGIHGTESTAKFIGNNLFVANTAGSRGAAISSSFTTMVFQGDSSFVSNSAKYGGGVYCESSNLIFTQHGSSHFLNNTALRGGAQYFDLYSNLSLYQTAHVNFHENHATEFGGSIYALDVPGPGQFLFKQHIPFRSECFFHMLMQKQSPDVNTTSLVFVNNSAGIRGSILYGGLLKKCNFTSDRFTSAIELFSRLILHTGRKGNTGHSISSDPSELCFCNASKLNCKEVKTSRSIYPGQQVAVSVVATDQSGLTIPTLIHTQIQSGHNLTVSETISYETRGNCTSRNYSVTTKNALNQLELYPNNRSGNTIHLIVNITFESCPIGFEQSNFTGECICDHRLWQFTNSCDIDRQAILQNGSRTFWIGVSYNNGTFKGFIHHRYCPLDYCTRESRYINLINPDKQCNSNHSGLLCGKCKEGLSLVLGSSQCKQCSNNYLTLLVPLALAGVLLVILLFLLHLTVAEGTLHGLTFYANIVAANHHIFFPHTTNDPASIFIAWLNLDLGIQTCFYNGMDAYAKTWLEFVFPVYIWVIVGFLVYISHHSVTVTKLLGSSPVPVLATLFLLSYAKVLRNIIAALSLTILHYPDKNLVVWIHDANVPLAKYIPLVLVALLFLFLFLPYTLLLLLGQWLQPKSHLRLLCWVRSPKIKAILDTYHAPYKLKHRYWTGLLLLVRCALFLIFAFNISGDANINLLVISSIAFGIIGWLTFSGVVYKSRYLNAIEVSFILNLGMLAVATFYVTLSGRSQAAVAYTSVGIAFFVFVGIVIYHIYIRVKSKVQYTQRGQQLQCKNNRHKNNNNDNPGNLCHQPRATPAVTRTEVNLHELRSPLDLLSYHQMN